MSIKQHVDVFEYIYIYIYSLVSPKLKSTSINKHIQSHKATHTHTLNLLWYIIQFRWDDKLLALRVIVYTLKKWHGSYIIFLEQDMPY